MILLGFVLLSMIVFLPGVRTEFTQIFFRSWIPTWRYFDREGTIPVLSIRIRKSNQQLSPWKKVARKFELKFINLLLSPQGNVFLLRESFLRLFLSDPEVFHSVLENLALDSALDLGLAFPSHQAELQYRISFQCQTSGHEEEVYCSGFLPMENRG